MSVNAIPKLGFGSEDLAFVTHDFPASGMQDFRIIIFVSIGFLIWFQYLNYDRNLDFSQCPKASFESLSRV